MRGDVTTRRVPNGEPREKGKIKARKALLSFGSRLGEERKSVNARIDDVKMQKDEE